MRQRSVVLSMTLGMSVLASSACTRLYNGALGLNLKDRQTVEAYQQFKAERETRLREANTGQRARSLADLRAQTGQALAAEAMIRPHYTPQIAHHAIGPLGLYGQLTPQRPGRSSPMDSPGDIRRITFTTEGADFDPDVDPTGTMLVYASTRHRETADIYLKRIGNTAVTQLTNDPANEIIPVFSPDGKNVSFASDRSGNWDIYLMDVRGGQAKQISNDPTHDIHPGFSPDGTRLVYNSFGGPSEQWEIIIVHVANPTTRRVIGHGLFPTWSPKEDRIVFQRSRQRGTRWFIIWTMDVIGDDVSPPTEIAVSSNAAVITPDWSPNGRQITFCTVIDPFADDLARPPHSDVWVVNADGTGRRRLTGGQFTNLQPVWAADGLIYFNSNRAMDDAENIWGLAPGSPSRLSRPLETVPANLASMAPITTSQSPVKSLKVQTMQGPNHARSTQPSKPDVDFRLLT